MKRFVSFLCAAAILIAVCPMTAAKPAAFLPGDINGDDTVNNRDLGLLQRFLNDWDIDTRLAASDTNGDGNVNNKDLGLLQQFLNEWDVQLHTSLLEDNDYRLVTVSNTLAVVNHAAAGTAITAECADENAQCVVMGTNWCPEEAALVNERLSQSHLDFIHYVDMPTAYPPGEYRLGATVQTTDDKATHCTIRLFNGSTLVYAAELPVNRGGQTDVYLKAKTAFNRIALYSGSGNTGSKGVSAVYTSLCLSPLNQSALTYTPYQGRVRTFPCETTIETTPLYVFADTGATVDVTYWELTNSTPLPNDYYFTDNYLPDKAAVINQLLANSGASGEAFVFVTDPHTESKRNAGQTPSLIRYLSTQTDLSRVIVGGDVYVGTSSAYAEAMEMAFSNGTVHYVMGNHEYDRSTTDEALTDMYGNDSTVEIGNADRHYYYVDSPDTKLRYVVLNGWMEGSETVATDLATAQNQWLKNEALNVEEGWGILIFAHQFVNREWQGSQSRYFGTAWKPIAKTLLEYDGDGEILAVFHGHIHQDMINRMRLNASGNPVLDDSCGGIPLIGTTADKYYTDKEKSPYEFLIDREVGTITEQAFDVVVVDRENGQIHCVRIGAPARDGTGWIDQEQVEVRTVNIRE